MNPVKLIAILMIVATAYALCGGCHADNLASRDYSAGDRERASDSALDLRDLWRLSVSRRVSVALRAGQDEQGVSQVVSPSVTLQWPANSAHYRAEQGRPSRSDRYKNTIPAVFRLTLKGYSIMEFSEGSYQVWEFDRVKERALRKPEIMFSVVKRF